MAKTAERVANVEVLKGRTLTTLVVSVPNKPTTLELVNLQTTISDRIIQDLTGCACLSGAIELVFRDEFAESIRVDIASGEII
jgi:hypothetical protein